MAGIAIPVHASRERPVRSVVGPTPQLADHLRADILGSPRRMLWTSRCTLGCREYVAARLFCPCYQVFAALGLRLRSGTLGVSSKRSCGERARSGSPPLARGRNHRRRSRPGRCRGGGDRGGPRRGGICESYDFPARDRPISASSRLPVLCLVRSRCARGPPARAQRVDQRGPSRTSGPFALFQRFRFVTPWPL